jgi:hypothetical protein
METKLLYDMDDEISKKLNALEQRIRYWMEKKYDLLGINKDQDCRNKLFEYDMEIFLNQFLWRTINFKNF